MKIAFLGTPEFARIILEKLQAQFPVSLVITQPDRPVGREQTPTSSPVKVWASKQKIPIHTPTSAIQIADIITAEKVDLVIVAAYGPPFLNKEALSLPKFGCLNVHPSLLPKYRGASPVAGTLLAGEKETGVTIFKMTEIIDAGEIIAQTKTDIAVNENRLELTERLAILGGELLVKTLPNWLAGKIKPQTQSSSPTDYQLKLKQENAFVPWLEIAAALGKQAKSLELHNKIRAFYPWPAVWTTLPDGRRLKILKSRFENEKIILTEVQLAGRKPSHDSKFLEDFFQ